MLREVARKIGVGKALLAMRQSGAERRHAKWKRQNDARLSDLTNKHKGEDAVIIGMGPSLKVDDLERFGKMRSFACNKIFLSYNHTSWRPNYYSVIDILVAENNFKEIISADHGSALPLHSSVCWSLLKSQKYALCVQYAGSIAGWSIGKCAEMNENLADGILSHGYTVLVDQIQIAYAMGFQRVYLVGVDFKFHGGLSTNERCASGEVLIASGEQNHFHKDYRKPGEKWTVPKMQEQRQAFAFCRYAFEKSGRQLINASRISELDVLDKVDFETIF